MKISQIIQETSTTAGSIAPSVEHGFVKMQTRNPSVYGNTKAGNLLKGKKTNKPFANSLNEAAMKDLAYDLQTMKPAEFQKKYGKSREEMKASMSKQPQQRPAPPVNETDLSEQDLIVVPGQGRSVKTGFVPHDKDRTDHEVEMARSDLFSAAKNAKKVYSMIKDVSEDEGLDGWVQEKIIKANDYLNTIREYLEGKQVQGVSEGSVDYEEIFYLNDKQGKVGAVIQYKDKTFGFIYGTKLSPTKFTRAREAQQALSDQHDKQGVAEGAENSEYDQLVSNVVNNYIQRMQAAGLGTPERLRGKPRADVVMKAKNLGVGLAQLIKDLDSKYQSTVKQGLAEGSATGRFQLYGVRLDSKEKVPFGSFPTVDAAMVKADDLDTAGFDSMDPREDHDELHLLDTQTGQKFMYTDDGVNQEWEPIRRKKGVAEDEGKLDELSPQALGSYVKSAAGDMANRKGDTQFQKGARVATSAFNSKLPASRFEKDSKIEKRQAGIDRAVDKITGKK